MSKPSSSGPAAYGRAPVLAHSTPQRMERAAAMMRAIGWELRFRDSNSDKFYRVIVTHRIVVINYGRYGSVGQSYVNICTSLDEARGRAVKITVGKERKGYQTSRPITEFVIDRDDYSDIFNGDSPAKVTARDRIVQSFLAAAPEQGHP